MVMVSPKKRKRGGRVALETAPSGSSGLSVVEGEILCVTLFILWVVLSVAFYPVHINKGMYY